MKALSNWVDRAFFCEWSKFDSGYVFDTGCIEKAKKHVANYVKVVMLVFEVWVW